MYEHIRCNFLSSRYLLAWLALLNTWVVLLLWTIQLPEPYAHWVWVLRVVVLEGIGWHIFYIIRRDYLFNQATSVTACLYNKGAWQLVLASDEKVDVTLHGDTLVWYELIVLGFTLPNKHKRFIVIFPDTCDKNVQRQLRVALRLLARHQQSNKTITEKIKSCCGFFAHKDV